MCMSPWLQALSLEYFPRFTQLSQHASDAKRTMHATPQVTCHWSHICTSVRCHFQRVWVSFTPPSIWEAGRYLWFSYLKNKTHQQKVQKVRWTHSLAWREAYHFSDSLRVSLPQCLRIWDLNLISLNCRVIYGNYIIWVAFRWGAAIFK